MASPSASLTPAQARQIALKAQKLWSKPQPHKDGNPLHALTRDLGAVQLDTISVLARSHELVAFARLGAIPKADVETGYWHSPGSPATHFEYWSHAASILPIEYWPLFSFRRQHYRHLGVRWHDVDKKAVRRVKAQLTADGPMTTSDLGGGRKDAYWWNWSDVKVAVEFLLDIGEVAVTRRDKWRRVYDVAERAIPETNFNDAEPIDAVRQLLRLSLETLGVGTKSDILDVHRLKPNNPLVVRAWNEFIEQADVQPVTVTKFEEPHFALTHTLETLNRSKAQRAVLLSPFDSLVWHRPRLSRLFDMDYRIEAYTPQAQRTFGYFAMPVLVGDRIVARVDPARKGSTFIANKVTFQSPTPSETDILGVATALVEAAAWVGSTTISVSDVVPARCASALRQLAKV